MLFFDNYLEDLNDQAKRLISEDLVNRLPQQAHVIRAIGKLLLDNDYVTLHQIQEYASGYTMSMGRLSDIFSAHKSVIIRFNEGGTTYFCARGIKPNVNEAELVNALLWKSMDFKQRYKHVLQADLPIEN